MKTEAESNQISKTKHLNLETCLPFKNTRQSLVKSPMVTQQEPSAITNRMQSKTIQEELRDVANTFPHPAGLEIATDTVANATNIFSLATKNSGLVAKVATRF